MERHEDVGKVIAEDIGRSIAKKIAIGIALLFGFLFFILIGGTIVMWLWNWLVTDLFGLRRLGFWEALGLLALCRILFGGLGRSHNGGGGKHARSGRNKDWWRTRQPPPGAKASETVTHV